MENKDNRYSIILVRHFPVQTYPETYQIIDRGVIRQGFNPVLWEGTEEECKAYQIKHNLFELLEVTK